MKRFLAILSLAGLLSVAGCATTPNSGGGTSTGIDPAVIAQIQATATRVCGFLPTAQTVAGIIGTLTGTGPVVGIVGDVAQAICTAVTKKGLRAGQKPVLRGIRIEGRFVR